jgi:hypothetical protein
VILGVPLKGIGYMLFWDSTQIVTAHIYRRDGTSDGSFFRIDDPGGNLGNRGIAGGTFIDTTAEDATSYVYIVILEDDNGKYSLPSNELFVDAGCLGESLADADADGVADECDNCPTFANVNQLDLNGNGIGDVCETCCNGDGRRGNVDYLVGAGGEIDVGDLTFLTIFLFQDGPAPPCEEEGNVDGITGAGGATDIGDLTYMVSFLFQNGPAPPLCH